MATAQRQLNGLKFSVERKCRESEDDDHTAMMQNHCFGEKLLQGSEIAVSLRKFLKTSRRHLTEWSVHQCILDRK